MKIVGLSVFITPNEKLYTVCLLDDKNNKFIIDKENIYKKVSKFPLMHYKVKAYDKLEDVFDFSKDYINFDYFELHKRFNDIKRKVWIFKGDSVTGKTFLSDKINLSKYETDCNDNLPNVFKEDIIVVGNKFSFDIDDVIKRVYDRENVDIIVVDFLKYI